MTLSAEDPGASAQSATADASELRVNPLKIFLNFKY